MTASFGQIVQFFPDGDDPSQPWVGVVTRVYGNDGYNYIDVVAVCPKSGGTSPHFMVPQNSNDTPGASYWVALDDAVRPQAG